MYYIALRRIIGVQPVQQCTASHRKTWRECIPQSVSAHERAVCTGCRSRHIRLSRGRWAGSCRRLPYEVTAPVHYVHVLKMTRQLWKIEDLSAPPASNSGNEGVMITPTRQWC